jgi:hypothetical protein
MEKGNERKFRIPDVPVSKLPVHGFMHSGGV